MSQFEHFLEDRANPFHVHAAMLQAVDDARELAAARRIESLQELGGNIVRVSWTVEYEVDDEGVGFDFPDHVYLHLADGRSVYFPAGLNQFDAIGDCCSVEIDGEPIEDLFDSEAAEDDLEEALHKVLAGALGIARDHLPGFMWLLDLHVSSVYRDQNEIILKPTLPSQ